MPDAVQAPYPATDRSQTCKPSPSPHPSAAGFASELGRCSRRAGRLVAGRGMAPLTLIKDGGNMATFAADFSRPISASGRITSPKWPSRCNRRLGHRAGSRSLHTLRPDEAENLVPWWVYQPVRRLMDACAPLMRWSSPCCSWSPSVSALRWRTGAVYPHHRRALQTAFEAVEAIEPGPVEGIRATGAKSSKRSSTACCRR